ncbi:MAG TPA: aconitate hydratase AcnA [Gemmatimonadaceae bacterium]|nr:aconitate hydratase AcnA [Gemmatimonadaceae bacterium]
MSSLNSFGSRATLVVDGTTYTIFRLDALGSLRGANVGRLPFTLKVLLENLLRNEDDAFVKRADVEALAAWDVNGGLEKEIAFRPARVLLQDFTGVPAVVDLAAMRDAIVRLGGDATRINPLQPADLVIDHSVQVDEYGSEAAFLINTELEFERNEERYRFLRWGQNAFRNFSVVPPGTGICHQVNLEYLGRAVFSAEVDGARLAYPDSLVGTDSHTTMINGLGVVGWGVGGIEAEAAMLGQPLSMLVPEVVGFKLHGKLPAGATATDLVLTVTQMLRKKKVVGKFVEFYGAGLSSLSLADRATIGNMAPEYGATVGFFPVDAETLRYLRFTGRSEHQVRLVEAYAKEQGLFRTDDTADPVFSDTLELDLSTVEPSLAGPKRPQDRVPLKQSKQMFADALKAELERVGTLAGKAEVAAAKAVSATPELSAAVVPESPAEVRGGATVEMKGSTFQLRHGAVVIAAITSCTNTSNPSVMLGAGLLAKKAVEKGLTVKPWVKTSLAPGSKVVTDYYRKAGVMESLEKLGFYLAGYGCTTCIGNSGPLPGPIADAVEENKLMVAAVLSGNRNFEGRVNPLTRFNYLASPPLVVAYAIAGRMDIDLNTEPLGIGTDGPVFLRDIWPSPKEVEDTILESVKSDMFRAQYANVFEGDQRWRALDIPSGDLYTWSADSTYVKNPPFFQGMTAEPPGVQPISGARVLAMLGDSITTDHISPAGSIPAASPAGKWLIAHGVKTTDFNSYGSRRGNHEVMMRGTFANIRLRNELAPGTEGGWTATAPGAKPVTIFDAAMEYQNQRIPLLVIAGKEYGTGSSRDWAAKGTLLLGVRAVIAESFERIHRSNLVGMGVLPLEFVNGETRQSLGLTGFERYDIEGLDDSTKPRAMLTVRATAPDGGVKTFQVRSRVDTPEEATYVRNGGILQYVLRSLARG